MPRPPTRIGDMMANIIATLPRRSRFSRANAFAPNRDKRVTGSKIFAMPEYSLALAILKRRAIWEVISDLENLVKCVANLANRLFRFEITHDEGHRRTGA